MQRTLLSAFVITLISLIVYSNGQPCPCITYNNNLQCNVTSSSSTVDTSLCNTNGFNSINIIYNGNVTLSVSAPSKNSIFIIPVDESGNHTIQISTINTNATLIQVRVILSANQISLPLFTSSNDIIALYSILRISVKQIISDANSFTIFTMSPTTTRMIFAYYELIFDQIVSNSSILNFANLIGGLTSVLNITISGNNHSLAVNSSQIPLFNMVNRLALKNLRLYDRILDKFSNLKEYSIEECEYNGTAQFLNLNSPNDYNLSLEMINNNPLDSTLPNGNTAFAGLNNLINIMLVEPGLNSSCLRAISSTQRRETIILELGSYQQSEFARWSSGRPLVEYIQINNIPNLNIFPSKFFNKFDALTKTILQGTFELENEDICAFAGINIQPRAIRPILVLNSTIQIPDDQYQCADTYVKAINQQSMADVRCAPNDTCLDCERWAQATQRCDLISYENSCSDVTVTNVNPFYYNNSALYNFFQTRFWLNTNRTNLTISTGNPQQEPLNIGAIVGALCALIIAAIVLILTIYCIRRHRQKDTARNLWYKSTTEGEYKPSSFDSSHVSIATSKTSQSSRYALQKSFFPPMQAIDEIAPPLYTATSESARSASTYHLPTAPSAPRDSVSTHATHLYETLDP